MGGSYRLFAFVLCLPFIIILALPQMRQSEDDALRIARRMFDDRPALTVLLLGNGRTYMNDLPSMVMDVADSAGSRFRYDITSRAWSGAALADFIQNPATRALLQQHWDYIVLQPASGELLGPDNAAKFAASGRMLVSSAQTTNSRVAVIVNWAYGDRLFASDNLPYSVRQDTVAATEEGSADLARETGAGLIDVSDVWEQTRYADPKLPLYGPDDNLPTVNGTYIDALMMYGYLAGGDISGVRFRPRAMAEGDAAILKALVAAHYAKLAR